MGELFERVAQANLALGTEESVRENVLMNKKARIIDNQFFDFEGNLLTSVAGSPYIDSCVSSKKETPLIVDKQPSVIGTPALGARANPVAFRNLKFGGGTQGAPIKREIAHPSPTDSQKIPIGFTPKIIRHEFGSASPRVGAQKPVTETSCRLAQVGIKGSVYPKTRNNFITPSTCASSNWRNSRVLATFTNRGTVVETAASGAESVKGSVHATMFSHVEPQYSSAGGTRGS